MRALAPLLLALVPMAALAQAPSGSRIEVSERAPVQGPAAAKRPPGRPDIEVAYRAFASGDLDSAERMLTQLIERRPSPAAYLLRGCTRYTRARLSRHGEELTETAREDVRRAFALNPSLWLDPRLFSPRLIAFLDEVRQTD